VAHSYGGFISEIVAAADKRVKGRSVHVPLNLPLIDITAEHTWVDGPDELAAMRRAHSEFVAASPNREGIFASGSGHYVFKDQPHVVTDAILRMIIGTPIRETNT